MRDVYSVRVPRTADFNDEESDSFADEMVVSLSFVASPEQAAKPLESES